MRGKVHVARSGRLPQRYWRWALRIRLRQDSQSQDNQQAEAATVRRLFQWASEGVSRYQIALRSNEDQIATKRGKKWHPLGVGRILTNRAYTGVQYYGKNRYRKVRGGREVTARPESEWIKIRDFAPPLITQAQFDAVQERLKVSQAMARKPHFRYLHTGFIRCAKCGAPIVGASQQKTIVTIGAGLLSRPPRNPSHAENATFALTLWNRLCGTKSLTPSKTPSCWLLIWPIIYKPVTETWGQRWPSCAAKSQS